MKFLRYTKQLAAVAIVASLFTACDKVKEVDVIGDRGQTLVKFIKGGATDDPGFNKFAIDFVPTPITLTVADIRRDIPNNTELNRVMNVTVIDDTAALRLYNENIAIPAGTTTYEYLPAAWYTIDAATPKVGGDGGTFNLVLQPGEFAKQINITIPDPTVLDPSTSYALPFTITTVDANGVISVSRTLFATVGAKNKYDGVYHLTGQFYHPSRSPDYHHNDWGVELWTVSGDACKMYSPDFIGFYHPFYDITSTNPGNINAFGGQEPRYTVNSATNAVVVDNTSTGPAYSMGLGYNNAGYNSYWDDGTKTMYACFGYGIPGGVFTPAGASRMWIDTLQYLGPR